MTVQEFDVAEATAREKLAAYELPGEAIDALINAAGPNAAVRALEWAKDIRFFTDLGLDETILLLAQGPSQNWRHNKRKELIDLGVPLPQIRRGSYSDFEDLCAGVVALQSYRSLW